MPDSWRPRRPRRRRPTHGEVIELLHCIVQKLDRMEDKMSALDEAVSGLTTEIDRVLSEVVDDLRSKLAQAQADDAAAAEVAADVEENVAKLEELRTRVAGFEAPSEPTDPSEPQQPVDPAEPTA